MKNKLMGFILVFFIINIIISPISATASIINQEIYNGVKTYYVSSIKENIIALNYIKSKMVTEATIIYSKNNFDISDNFYTDIMEYNVSPEYNIFFSTFGIRAFSGCSIDKSLNKNGDIVVNYRFFYTQNKDETKYVEDVINNDIINNIANLKTDYEKVYWAYSWVLDNVNYDFTVSNYSAYSGLTDTGTVCQGYAMLYSLLLNKLGIECVSIDGGVNGNEYGHTWNVVKLNEKWYCVDPTWGDYHGKDKYFLKTKTEFESKEYSYHKSSEYDEYIKFGEVFAETDYDTTNEEESYSTLSPSIYDLEVDTLKFNILTVGEKYQYLLSNKSNISIDFISDNIEVVKINNKGVVTAVGTGTADVYIYNNELGISESCKIFVNTK